MQSKFKYIYFHKRLYYAISALVIGFLISFWLDIMFYVASIGSVLLVALLLVDFNVLFKLKQGIIAKRSTPEKFSNSDENKINIALENRYGFKIDTTLIDELPLQFQERHFRLSKELEVQEQAILNYEVRPTERGVYSFGRLNVFVSSALKLVKRRYIFDEGFEVKCYPSYLQMRKFEFLAMNQQRSEFGLKKIRRIGHTLEFEQIKDYVIGDDVRTINWKKTAKMNRLMVNQYQDEKSQPIYSIIDVSRSMKMPFNGLKLLDYAINSSLAFSNIAIRKNDKAGLIAFSKEIHTLIPASNKKSHLNVLNDGLYRISTDFLDSDFGYLYTQMKRKIRQRSLVILYTNFEHRSGLKRQMPYLKSISKHHVLVVVFFENSELQGLIDTNAEDISEIYTKTIAEKFAFEKRIMVRELESHGIHAILSKPEALSVNVINKYLEFKSRGLI